MINGGKFDEKWKDQLEMLAQRYYSKSFKCLCSGRKRLLRQQILVNIEENDNKT